MEKIAIALLISTVGGYIVLGPCIEFMRRSSKIDPRYDPEEPHPKLYNWAIFWLGCTERGIATALFIYAPGQLGLFVGGWTAAKIAGGWGHPNASRNPAGYMSALIGTAWSFGIAIGAGYWANPGSLVVLNSA